MMKKRTQKKVLLVMIILATIMIGQFSASANGLETGNTSESVTETENGNDITQGTEEDSGSEQNTEGHSETAQQNDTQDIPLEEITENITQNMETDVEEEDTPSVDGADGNDDSQYVDIEGSEQGQQMSDDDGYRGLYYYLNKYKYDREIVYLQKYIEYINTEVKIYEEMYNLGDTTETVLKSYQAQRSSINAELQTAQNESAYYNVYLRKNELDYGSFDLKELKTVHDIDYYIENYPEKDYMTLARYVTNYNNAVAYIEAKKTEIESLKANVNMAELLAKEGELSELELLEKEVALAKAEYELEGYYVDMNIAYCNLNILCKN